MSALANGEYNGSNSCMTSIGERSMKAVMANVPEHILERRRVCATKRVDFLFAGRGEALARLP
jgi:hypothetical protein